MPIRLPRPACLLAGILLAFAALPASTRPARADFRVCNNTGSRIGIALGYNDGRGWVTEGWFNLRANRCDTLLRGALKASYYYVYGVDYDRGGEWGGKSFMCTREREFTIRGSDNCYARGFDRSGFFEVNTGQQRDWTVELNDGTRTPGTR